VDTFAEELIAALGTAQPIAPFTGRDPSFDAARD
jgi:hypothetical protein